MLYAGLDLPRQRVNVHVLEEDGATIEVTAVRPDADALWILVERIARHGQPVTATLESMNGARFVHDSLERAG
jgi:transposase